MHYPEENLLQKMSEEINYSSAYMSIKFKKDTGITFQEFLQTVRMNTAVTLLHDTNMSVPEVAAAVGYKDITHFYKIFDHCIAICLISFIILCFILCI